MIETFASASDLARSAAGAVAARLAAGIAERGRASLVATGGRSVGAVYDRLAETVLDWARVSVTLSDDRWVDARSPHSNVRLVRSRLLRAAAAAAAFIPLWPEDPTPALGALLPFDAVLLGMGEDGHIASLIPGMPGLAKAMDPANPALVQALPAGWGSPPLARITLTLAALLKARSILILTAGGAKRRVLEAALSGADLPVRAVLAQDRVPVRVLWAPAYDDGK